MINSNKIFWTAMMAVVVGLFVFVGQDVYRHWNDPERKEFVRSTQIITVERLFLLTPGDHPNSPVYSMIVKENGNLVPYDFTLPDGTPKADQTRIVYTIIPDAADGVPMKAEIIDKWERERSAKYHLCFQVNIHIHSAKEIEGGQFSRSLLESEVWKTYTDTLRVIE